MKLKKIYMALSLSLLLSSCRSDEPVQPETGFVEIPLSFTIQLAVEDQNTRAGADGPSPRMWGDQALTETTDAGTDFDNTINTLRPVLYICSQNGNSKTIDPTYPVAVLEGETLTKANIVPCKDSNDKVLPGQYEVNGTMVCSGLTANQLLEYEDRLRLAVFINCNEKGDWKDVMAPLDITDPAAATFNHHGKPDDHLDDGSEHFHGIPMYGVSGVKFLKETYTVGTETKERYSVYAPTATEANKTKLNIDILRSMAKVRVKLKTDDNGAVISDLENVKITELYISRHAMQGYVVPNGWDTNASVSTGDATINPITGSIANNYNHSCTVDPQEVTELGVGGIHKPGTQPDYFANSTELLRFYLPDTYNYHNDGQDSKEIYLRLKYEVDGTPYTHLLWFRPIVQWPKENGYDEAVLDNNGKIVTPSNIAYPTAGNPWNITRNHIYEFVIEGVEAATGELKVNVAIKDWLPYHYEIIY